VLVSGTGYVGGMIYLVGSRLSTRDALLRLRVYPKDTPERYDLPPCQPGVITVAEIHRTQAVHSRISKVQGEWFIERSTSWAWSSIPADACLRDADPEEEGGLCDTASAMYDHFFHDADRPSKVNVAKISKVLHLKYPGLIPILDRRLLRIYRTKAEQAAKKSHRWQAEKALTWEAIRQDLIRSDLSPLRMRLAQHADLAVLSSLTDLRLLDALAWSI
jgi:hypothetical protein